MGHPQKIILSEVIFLLAFLFVDTVSHAQTIYGVTGWPSETLLSIEVNSCTCNLTEIGALQTSTGDEIFPEGGFAVCPDGSMYVQAFGELFTVDPGSGLCTLVPGLPLAEYLSGLACAGNGILYGVEEIGHGNLLYQYDLNAMTVNTLGSLPYSANAGMFYLNDDLYLLAPEGVVLVDTLNPGNSTLIYSWPMWYINGGTVYGSCNSLLIYTVNNTFALLSLLDGSIVDIGCNTPFNYIFMSGLSQFSPPGPCTRQLDLDCNDSSGADGADFNSPFFTCLTPSGVRIGDDDIVVFGDAIIDQMTVTISPAYMPDGADEILDVNMAIPNLNVTGIGSPTLIFSNTSGTATFNDFINALHATIYINTSPQFTPGIRSVEVEYTNVDGVMSDLATAFINVVMLPLIQVNLGPDLILCDGESPTFNAGNPGSTYLWSTQQATQTITVTEPDIYSVTVSNGIDCPNADTVALEILPIIEIALIGDLAICDNETANLTITLNTSIPVSIEIESSTGSTFAFADLTGNHSFTDPISGYTEYELTSIDPSSAACIHLIDSIHAIEVFPTYNTFVDTSICEGDSVWLGTYWQTNPGTYGSTYTSVNGCDSIVTTHIETFPQVMIFYQFDTCDASAAGEFITFLENPNGCDTIVQTTISLLPSDTMNFTFTTCISSQTGIQVDTLTNVFGCDSLLITTTLYQPPADTTHVSMVTCDSALLGIFYDTLISTDGCDSIVALTIQYATIDTTYSTGQSCIPANIGVFTTVYTDAHGCDSVVIRTVTTGTPDTTYLFQTSCDPASLGEFEDLLISSIGCDSLIITTVTFSSQDSTFLTGSTCDPSEVGVFIIFLENPNGCDTIVQTTISLLPSDTTNFTLTTCVSSQTDIDIDTLTNTLGCDSLLITTTIYHPPTDTTHLSMVTCDSALLGIFYDTLISMDGCDSIVALTIQYATIDTTYSTGQSCIPANIGVFTTVFTDAQGCDSVVIRAVTSGMPDTTYLFQTSCDPASLGVFEDLLISSIGCDSLIITTVTFSAQDSTFLTGSTCNSSAAGVFVSSYTNQFGCDSIVTETILLNISHQISITSSSCMPSDTGVFTYQLINQYGCDSIVTETISLLPSNQTQINETTCHADQAGTFITAHFNQYGCDSTVTRVVALVAADTTRLNFYTCDANEVEQTEIAYIDTDGCDSLVIQTTSLFPLPTLIVEAVADYNGVDISCEGSTDGSAIANVNGVGPFSYLWSTNDTDQMITGLSAGDYDVAITDGNGCMTFGTVTLTEPDAFMIGFEVSEPDCFDQQLGSITVLPIGGVAPFTYSIDGTVFQTSPIFTGLDEGIYQITSLDANDCRTTEIISIDVPLLVNVELGENQSISIGDSTLLEAIINLPFDSLSSVMWTGIDSIGCANCLTQIVAPIITTAYSVSVISADGCADRDSMTVFVNTDNKIYIPNIFSPNGDGINDVIMISADESVREITSFSIFDRWGNLVFGAEHFQPNDPSRSWDGKMKGEAMNPGVFTFRVVVDFSDGHSEVRYGDITLMR